MMMQSNEEITDNEIFTFEDWLSYRVFYHVENGVQMCNDSGNLSKLIYSKIDIDTLNKIQKEQSIVYEIMINRRLESMKSLFRIKYVRESVEPLEYLKMKIESVENNLKVTNKETYYDIISTRKERGIKYGAKLISPSNYYHYNNIKVGRTKIRPDSYEGLIRNDDYDIVFLVNMWVEVESRYYFLQWLKRLQAGEFGFGYSDDNLIIELSTSAPKAEAQGNKQKAGRPESKEVAERNNKIYKEYLRLTETRTDAEARPILLTTFKRYFKRSHETNRRSLDRILQKMKGQ